MFSWDDKNKFDIIFIDISMKLISGIELAKIIRESNKIISIVFITGNSEFVFQGYDVQALNYLLKPVNKTKLFECLCTSFKNNNLVKHDKDTLVIESVDSIFKLDYKSILYCTIYYPWVYIHTSTDKIEVKMKFSELENKLKNKGFVKPHRSYLVNLRNIVSLNKNTIHLDNNDIIPISRLKIKYINDRFLEFYTTQE